ncbi:MAG TPA: hypothetical protein DEB46_10880, partial [Myxococcales bacterium]|nr:hypothetical protein [Myxococcales bacterium]
QCRNNCALPVCGDGLINGDEACDDGNRVSSDACTAQCQPARCGDGFVRLGLEVDDEGFEACDDGNNAEDDACRNNCVEAACGDEVVRVDLIEGDEGFEACDDGNDLQTDACLNDCIDAACGDGFVHEGTEACDDGNDVQTDACLVGCIEATCGDNLVHEGVEECDDGNQENNDECSELCEVQGLGEVEGLPGLSCKAILDAGASRGDGAYWIDPDGVGNLGAFQVTCDMDDGGWTLIDHNMEARTQRQGCEDPGCHNIPVTYTPPLAQILALIDDQSTECRQYLLWECKGSGIWENNSNGGNQYTWWHDRNDSRVNDWPGGNTDACDTNDEVWRQNGGHITDRNQLPVRRLRHGDTTAPTEEGYHTLGKLYCR